MIVQFIFAFFYSIIFALILSFLFKRHAPGPFGGILYFFAIIFLFTLAIGAWVRPMGPRIFNVPWLSFLAIAFVIMLLIAELRPHKERMDLIKRKQAGEDVDEEVLEKEFSIIVWVIIAGLVAAITYAIFRNPF